MTKFFPDLPRYICQRGDEWQGADHQNGPWRPIPAPQSGLPWKTDGPAVPESREPASVAAEARPTYSDRLALAVCINDGMCSTPCDQCRQASAGVAREIARQLRERHGSSATADWLDGVGCHG